MSAKATYYLILAAIATVGTAIAEGLGGWDRWRRHRRSRYTGRRGPLTRA